jgi:hypothetical protein
VAKKRRVDRDAEKRRLAFVAGQRRLERRRVFLGFLGVVPLIGWLGCGSGTPLDALCFISRDVWILVWAALFGSFLGITIRLILERRKFQRAERGAARG